MRRRAVLYKFVNMSKMENLDRLKYSELQKLAKDVGIKANMKSDKLIKALQEHFDEVKSSSKSCETSQKILIEKAENTESESKVNISPVAQPKKTGKQRVTKKAKRRGKKTQENQIELSEGTKDVENSTESCTVGRSKRKLSQDTETEQVTEQKQDDEVEIQPSKRRRGTFEILPAPTMAVDEVENTSLVKEDKTIIDVNEVMKPEMSNDDLKHSLMAAIDQKVEKKLTKEGNTDSHIPRFAAFLAKKKAAQIKPVTPGNKNWTKIHEKQFSKMDSLDVYLEKKKQRNASISNSIKRAREAADETRNAMLKLKNHKTPDNSKIRRGLPMPFRSPFKPTVTSTKSMNLKFGGTAKTPVFGASKPRTPAVRKSGDKSSLRKSPRNVENLSASKMGKVATDQKITSRKSLGTTNQPIRRKSCVTPFKPMNTTLDNASTKKQFDLQASLAKPLTWKPYTGKLKPVQPSNPGVSSTVKSQMNTTVTLKTHTVKVPPLKNSRANRMTDVKGRRADKKFNEQMKRRGIVS